MKKKGKEGTVKKCLMPFIYNCFISPIDHLNIYINLIYITVPRIYLSHFHTLMVIVR